MAEIEKKHYNLRSGNETVKLPVQIQLSNDSEFLNKVIQNYQITIRANPVIRIKIAVLSLRTPTMNR